MSEGIEWKEGRMREEVPIRSNKYPRVLAVKRGVGAVGRGVSAVATLIMNDSTVGNVV